MKLSKNLTQSLRTALTLESSDINNIRRNFHQIREAVLEELIGHEISSSQMRLNIIGLIWPHMVNKL